MTVAIAGLPRATQQHSAKNLLVNLLNHPLVSKVSEHLKLKFDNGEPDREKWLKEGFRSILAIQSDERWIEEEFDTSRVVIHRELKKLEENQRLQWVTEFGAIFRALYAFSTGSEAPKIETLCCYILDSLKKEKRPTSAGLAGALVEWAVWVIERSRPCDSAALRLNATDMRQGLKPEQGGRDDRLEPSFPGPNLPIPTAPEPPEHPNPCRPVVLGFFKWSLNLEPDPQSFIMTLEEATEMMREVSGMFRRLDSQK